MTVKFLLKSEIHSSFNILTHSWSNMKEQLLTTGIWITLSLGLTKNTCLLSHVPSCARATCLLPSHKVLLRTVHVQILIERGRATRVRITPTPRRAPQDLVVVEVELWRHPVLVTLLTQHVLPDPPPTVLPLDARAPRLLLLLVLALDIL